jgi:hypothetical protein
VADEVEEGTVEEGAADDCEGASEPAGIGVSGVVEQALKAHDGSQGGEGGKGLLHGGCR